VIGGALWRHNFLRAGIAVLLGFRLVCFGSGSCWRCGVRTSRWRVIVVSRRLHRSIGAASRRRTGRNQSVVVLNPALQVLLRDLVSSNGAGATAVPFLRERVPLSLPSCLHELGLDKAYVPHSLRHGGANSIAYGGLAGRRTFFCVDWESTKSAVGMSRQVVQFFCPVAFPTTSQRWPAFSLRHSFPLSR